MGCISSVFLKRPLHTTLSLKTLFRIVLFMQLLSKNSIFNIYYFPTKRFNAVSTLTSLGVIHIWRPLWGGWGLGVKQKWYVIGRRGWRLASVLDVQSLFFFIKEDWICVMTRHHTNYVLLTRNLPFDSNVRQ